MAFPTTSLLARAEAKDETGYVDGDTLTGATDQSAAGNDLSVVDGTPTWQSAVLNGEAVYRFDGASTLKHSAVGILSGASAVSVAAVVRSTDAATTGDLIALAISENVWVNRIYIRDARAAGPSGTWLASTRSSTASVADVSSTADSSAWSLVVVVWDGTTVELWVDGVSQGTAALSGTIAADGMVLGGNTSAAQLFTGDVALGAWWSKALTPTEIADLEEYSYVTYGVGPVVTQTPDAPATALDGSGTDGAATYIDVYPSDAYSDADGHTYASTSIQYSLTSDTGPWTEIESVLTRPTSGPGAYRILTTDVSATTGDSVYVRTADADDTDGLGAYGTVLSTFFPLVGEGTDDPPTIDQSTLPDGEVDVAYSQTLTATSAGTGAATAWTVTVGSLPAGLALNATTGEISGTPTTVEAQTLTVQYERADAETATQELTITVAADVQGNVTLDGANDSGALVLLLDTSTDPVTETARKTTNAGGDYAFGGITAGDYVVVVEASDGSTADGGLVTVA